MKTEKLKECENEYKSMLSSLSEYRGDMIILFNKTGGVVEHINISDLSEPFANNIIYELEDWLKCEIHDIRELIKKHNDEK